MTLRKLLPVATGLCLAAHAAAAQSAGYGGTELRGKEVPGWALGTRPCHATLISPRVAITNALCVKQTNPEFFHRLDDLTPVKVTMLAPATVKGPHEDVAVVVLDKPIHGPVVPIPSYRSERRSVVEGARLTLYAPILPFEPFQWRKPAKERPPVGAYRYDYFTSGSVQVPLKLVSLESVAGTFPMVGYDGSTDTALAALLGHADSVIAVPRFARGDDWGYMFPLDSQGGTLLAGEGAEQVLVGFATRSQFHVRASNVWPATYRKMLDHGLRDDALSLALRVLNPFEDPGARSTAADWRSSARALPLGSIWPREHKASGKIEFFRLVKAAPDGRHGALPSGPSDGNGWEYLGEELPDLAAATATFRGPPRGDPDDAKTPIGTIAVNVRRTDGGVEYFRLTAIGNDGKLTPFPQSGRLSLHWAFYGTDLTSRRLSRDIDFQDHLHLDQPRPPIRVANDACEGALISPRVIVTAADCIAEGGPTQFKLTDTGEILVGKGFRPEASATGLPGPGLVLLDPPAPLKEGRRPYVNSYQFERQRLGGIGLTDGVENAIISFSPRTPTTVKVMAHLLEPDFFRILKPGQMVFLSDEAFARRPQTSGPFAVVLDDQRRAARMSHYWPWIYRTLMNAGAREEALVLAAQVLNPWQNIERSLTLPLTRERVQQSRLGLLRPDLLDWNSFDRRGVIGRVYAYDNPYTKQVEFFRLAKLGSDGRYGYFPVDQKDNEEWEYLGTDLPSCEAVLTPVKAWSPGVDGVAGELFVHRNSFNKQFEYFELVEPFAQGGDEPPPSNGTDSRHWRYRGTDVPISPADEGPGGCG
ncbi:hypothetical protein CDL60_21080 [Roseateles noduli]|nr:hypothetical protein CDL60_21080 [Roseateles noduli]